VLSERDHDRIRELVRQAPPLSAEQRARLRLLLAGATTVEPVELAEAA
jgi:hypothetical protein